MNIKVSGFQKNECVALSFDEMLKVSEKFDIIRNEIKALITGNLQFDGQKFLFDGNVDACYSMQCARCLKETPVRLHFEMSQIFSKTPDAEKDELSVVEGFIDLRESVISYLAMYIGFRVLCKDDCKGLCSICGNNLNEIECDCKEEKDSVFDQLDGLF